MNSFGSAIKRANGEDNSQTPPPSPGMDSSNAYDASSPGLLKSNHMNTSSSDAEKVVHQALVILLLVLAMLLGAFVKVAWFPQGGSNHRLFEVHHPELAFMSRSLDQTLQQLLLQVGTLGESADLLSEEASKVKKDVTQRRAELLSARHAKKKKLSAVQKALRVVVSGRIDDFKSLRDSAKEAVEGELKKLTPPPTSLPQFNGGAGAVGYNGAGGQVGDSRPGPAYVPPPDAWADDGLSPEEENDKRKEAVMDAFKHSWDGYVKYAWGKDELQPQSKDFRNWNEGSRKGMGLTILDALTTMHLMGHMEEDKEKALEWVRNDLNFNIEVEASAFESTIRCLGSLLSTYELTGEKDTFLLAQAVDLADRLLYVFNTSHGLPHSTVNLKSKRHFNQQWAGGGSILSEFGTMQLEFRTLSYHTKNPIYDMKATHAMAIILSKAPRDMLCPTYMSTMHLRWMTDHISIGALGDSFYEYLLKQYLLTGKTEDRYKDAYLRAAHAIMDKLVFYSRPSNWAYIAEYRRKDFYHKMDHLACFAAGMLAFGANQLDPEAKEKTMKIAADLTETCTLMYTRQQSGVSPEFVEFPGGGDFVNGAAYYILRPEAMEAVFYMWRLTKDQHWRDVGWKMFAAINRWCRMPVGYAGLQEVNTKKPNKDNLQQSFWFAETLKYSFLLFAPDDTLNLDEWVLNTEGHPLKVRNRDPLDLWRDYEEEHGHPAWYPPPSDDIVFIETAMMAKDRANGKVKKPLHDPKSEEFEDGAVDDEGGPFDNANGMAGVKRKGVTNYNPPKPAAHDSKPKHGKVGDDRDEDEDSTPKPRKQLKKKIEDDDQEEAEEKKPKKKVKKHEAEDEDEGAEETKAPRRRRRHHAETPVEDAEGEDETPKKKKRHHKKIHEEDDEGNE